MNIILLSGGSGKRLWPLSNETRSKQFLKILTNEKGEKESMLQRVYRQIKTSCINANIIIATGASQADLIRNQLGDKVELVIEPQRRDTFPAIVLAASYLKSEKKINVKDPVIVLPVDLYVELEYFYLLKEMEKFVKNQYLDIVLMGIKPTYPSEKYGYIIPKSKFIENQNGIKIFETEKFIEKPSLEKATELVKQGSMWNGGVFAFQLEYLLNILNKQNIGKTFQQVQENYNLLKKISFDYEVVEKAEKVYMISYYGYWRDLGTWNTLTEEMKIHYTGKVITGEEIEDTHIINELDIPIVVLGTKQLVIAASPDGILVSDKIKSSYMKPYVDLIKNRPMYEEYEWGEFKVLNLTKYEDGVYSLTKYITIKQGQEIKYQSNHIQDRILVILDGECEYELNDSVCKVTRGDVLFIDKTQKYFIRAKKELHMIEIFLDYTINNTNN